jgi:hypothetical protein
MAKPPERLLEALGFINVYDTEEIDPRGKKRGVQRAPKHARLTYGTFRNVTVVYDELGRAWVRERPLKYQEILDLDLLVGGPRAFVPHVEDNGEFLKSRYKQFRDIDISGPHLKPR